MPRFLHAPLRAQSGPDGLGGFANRRQFTANGTFTVPDGITTVFVTATGGGGGSAGGASGTAGGGGGATIWRRPVPVTPGLVLTITVGAGGTAGANPGNGGNGGDSTVTGTGVPTVTAKGGNGAAPGAGAGGTSGSALEPPLAFDRMLGSTNFATVRSGWYGFEYVGESGSGASGASAGGAGRSFWSSRATAPTLGGAETGDGYGAGAAGVSAAAGQAGRAGVVYLEW